MSLLKPKSSRAPAHFLWLLSAAAFLFAGVVWSGSQAYAVELSPAEAQSHEDERAEAERVALLGRLAAGRNRIPPGRASTAAGHAGTRRACAGRPTSRSVALARYMAAVGTDSVETAVLAVRLARWHSGVLADDRINLASGYGDVAGGQRRSRGSSRCSSISPRRMAR